MMQDKSPTLLAVLLLALAVVPAESQEMRGRIVGVVKDHSGAILPGVTVTATGPALIQPQATITGPQGAYRFPALPPGIYEIRYELSGFQTLIRQEIRVSLNMTLTLDADLALAGMEETLTVTGESPVLDIKTTTTGTHFTEELLEDIPNARDIWAAMAQAPGFHMEGYDVGGSHTGTQTEYATYGYDDQNRTLLEGINVTENTDVNAGYFDYGSFEEFQLAGAGNMAETHGMGAFFNLTVKSGGDDFHGDLYFDFENEATIADNVPDELREPDGEKDGFKAPAGGLQSGNPITQQTDLNLGVGGPIVPGHAWFYGSYRNNDQYKKTIGFPEPAQTQLINWTIKGTWAIDSANHLIAFYNQRTKLQAARELSTACPIECSWYQASKNIPWKLEWTRVVSDRTFLDVQYSSWKNMFPLFPQQTRSADVEGIPAGYLDLATDQRTGATDFYWERTVTKPQLSGRVSFYRDDWKWVHNLMFGTEVYRERRRVKSFQPEDLHYRTFEGAGVEADIYNTPNEGINDSFYIAFYAQDSWTIRNRLTLNLGARFDHYKMGWPEQSFTPNRADFFEPVSVQSETVAVWNSLGPRVGMAYDLTGRGKTVLKAFFGRFYDNPSIYVPVNENPVGQAALRYEWNDVNRNLILDPGPDGSLASSPELGAFLQTLGGAGGVRVDRDIEHPYGNELSAHVEHERIENLSLRASYVYKASRRGTDTVDLNRISEYTIPVEIHDLGEDNIAGTPDDQILTVLDRPADISEDRTHTNPSRWGLQDIRSDYHTVELALNRRFKDNWMLLTSFQHTWASDIREPESPTNSRFLLRNDRDYHWFPNRRRFAPDDSSWWNVKVAGRYIFPNEIGVSASYKLQSGYNYARRINFQLPNAGTDRTMARPLDEARAPNVGIFDLRVEKTFTIHPRWGRVTGIVDIFNLVNAAPVINARNTSGSRYLEIISLLDPRVVRFGVRYEF